MQRLYVLYDHSCGLCTRAAHWLRDQPQFVPLELLPASSQRAANLFPALAQPYPPPAPTPGARPPPAEVIVVSDSGEVYRGTSAWLMCLWALRRYRGWSFVLARPRWRPLTVRMIALLGRYRIHLSELLHLEAEQAATPPTPPCGPQGCARP